MVVVWGHGTFRSGEWDVITFLEGVTCKSIIWVELLVRLKFPSALFCFFAPFKFLFSNQSTHFGSQRMAKAFVSPTHVDSEKSV